jgi:hypothetical protein
VGGHLNQLGSQPSLAGDRRESSFDQPEGVALLQGPPALPPEYRGRVDQQDLLDHRVPGDPDPFQAAGPQRRGRAGRAGGCLDGAPPDVGLQRFQEIARLVGHASTRTTEIVYRHELRPVITTGAEIMDQLFTAT